MPTSDLTIINFRQEWLVGPDVVFDSGFEADTNEPFFTSVTLEPDPPFVEKVRETIQPTAVGGVEGPIIYGGNFKPVLQAIEVVEVASQDLDNAQIQVIEQNLTVNVSPDPGGQDVFELNITPIAQAGAQFFELKIPYEETDIVNNSPDIVIPFLQLDGADTLPTETIVGVDQTNEQFIIFAGNQTIQELVLEINDITGGTRNFVSKTAQVTTDNLILDWTEDIDNQPLIIMDDPGNTLPQFNQNILGTNVVGINYRYFVDINPTTDVITIAVNKSVEAIEGGAFETLPVPLFTIRAAPGVNVRVNKGSQGATGMLTLQADRQNNPSNPNLRKMPLIYIRNNHTFNQPVNLACTDTQIEISSTRDAIGTPATAFATVSPTMKMTDVIDAINTAIATVPEWVPWFEAVLYENQYRPLGGQNMFLYNIGEDAQWGSNLSGTDDGIMQGTYIIQDNGGNVPDTMFGAADFVSYGALFYHVSDDDGLDVTVMWDASDLANTIETVFEAFKLLVPFPYKFDIGAIDPLTFNNANPDNLQPTPIEYYQQLPIAAINDGTYTAIGNNGFFNRLGADHIDFDHDFEGVGGSYNYSIATDTMNSVAAALEADANLSSIGASIEAGLLLGEAPVGLIDRSEQQTINSMIAPFVLTIRGEPGQTIPSTVSFPLAASTINELIDTVNLDATVGGAFEAVLLNFNRGDQGANSLIEAGPLDIGEAPSSPAKFIGEYLEPLLSQYDLNSFPTLTSLVNQINNDWVSMGLTASIRSETAPYPDAVSANLLEVLPGVSVFDQTVVLNGEVKEVSTPPAPREDVTLSFNIKFAAGGVPFEETGIQVALGGFTSEGTFFPNNAPNSFFEPGFNTLFPIVFNVVDADTIYLLLRTRKNLDGTLFLSEENDYAGRVTYANGFRSEQLTPFNTTDPQFVDVWTETNLGDPPSPQVPVVVAFDSGRSSLIDVFLEDILEEDSINVQIINAPDVLDDFAFLAVNRSNLAGSMTESQQGRVFGLVLDNRGVWDVLIGPEAILREVPSGVFSWLNSQYSRELIDDDEAYDFEFNNLAGLPPEVQNAISLIPVPGYPQVWALRIEKGVKDYLRSQRQGANRNSTTGCTVDIDLLVTGRNTEVQGICRVTVFFDVYCVFDTGLCDVFWNLINPPEPAGPDLIENTLNFTYQSLTDCDNLSQSDDGDNTEINAPILVTIDGIPVFENGNALLLTKSFYSAEVQGFYFPRGEDLTNIQFEDCSSVGDNVQLATRLNTPAIYLPDAPDQPITDPFEIANQLETAESYMYVKPAFQFPASDPERDCGPEEIVIIGIGYQFKNWTASTGTRSDDIMFGVNLVLPGGVFASPDLTLCYRYYYNREES